MAELPDGVPAGPSLEVPRPFVRIYTSIVKVDPKTQRADKLYFDVPLLNPPFGYGLTPWAWFMQNYLAQRGVLTEGGFIAEKMVEIIIQNPESNPMEHVAADLTNVVQLKR